ncbi:MAG: PepSY-like domain-containing protein [Bacteroidota bacterium]
MKKLSILLIALLPLLFSCGSKDKKAEGPTPPDAVQTAFEKQFPDVKDAEWDQDSLSWEAEFTVNGKEMNAEFDAAGKFIESEIEIELKEAPAEMQNFVKMHLAGKELEEIVKITDAVGKITFEIEISKDFEFDANGKFMGGECKNDEKVEVPEVVKAAFEKKFPGIKEVQWGKEDDAYEAEFEMKEKEMSANFDAKGILLATETEMDVKELPKAISDYFAKNVKDAVIKEAAKITDAKGVVTYEVEVNDTDYLFDAKGVFVKKSEEKPDAEKCVKGKKEDKD